MPRSRARAGFTLLEVLAAVAILGIWYVILAAVGIQGLRAEGESQRRLEAGFIADEVLAQIEAGAAAGVAPDEGITEEERDEFTVRIEVYSFDLDVPEPELTTYPSSTTAPAASEAPYLLAGNGLLAPSPLRRVRVEILWTEGASERSVIRDTFAVDLESSREALRALEATIAQDQAAEAGRIEAEKSIAPSLELGGGAEQ